MKQQPIILAHADGSHPAILQTRILMSGDANVHCRANPGDYGNRIALTVKCCLVHHYLSANTSQNLLQAIWEQAKPSVNSSRQGQPVLLLIYLALCCISPQLAATLRHDLRWSFCRVATSPASASLQEHDLHLPPTG